MFAALYVVSRDKYSEICHRRKKMWLLLILSTFFIWIDILQLIFDFYLSRIKNKSFFINELMQYLKSFEVRILYIKKRNDRESAPVKKVYS